MKMQMTDQRHADLRNVLAKAQSNIVYTTDMAQFGVIEKWAYPHGKGDCEDYALEIILLLIGLGWDKAMLDVGICRLNGEGHATVIAHTSDGDIILDNNLPKPTPWNQLPDYRWIERSVDGNFKKWVAIPQ